MSGYESHDLRKTNERAARKRQRMADYRRRTQAARNRVHGMRLLTAGIRKGWLK